MKEIEVVSKDIIREWRNLLDELSNNFFELGLMLLTVFICFIGALLLAPVLILYRFGKGIYGLFRKVGA